MDRFICIHGHFYQPPRENPWTDEVEIEDSAYPYHDWNSRITAECYAPNAASRILDNTKNIIDIVNNYASISFDFGPTLLTWLEQNSPRTYAAILEADRESRNRHSGHGSAMAQVYNHMIMPLANSRDKRTQVIWGIRDFVHRFGRKPEGMWLAETAVDLETLDIMAGEGILFTVLSPDQAAMVKSLPGSAWSPADDIDCSIPYFCRLKGGKTIAVFLYESSISHDIAFSNILENGEIFASRMMHHFSRPGKGSGMLNIVSDGETFGHHHRFADMALAYALYRIGQERQAEMTVFGQYLSDHPPTAEILIKEYSSWSCPHGIERWRSGCGCSTMGTVMQDTEAYPRWTPVQREAATAGIPTQRSWSQEWRRPLREAMDQLRDDLAPVFENAMGRYVANPWEARDDYIGVILDQSPESLETFLSRHSSRALTGPEKTIVLKALEMQRYALLMYTSCGWFFDDISGIESIQVMKYACRAIQLARELSDQNPEPAFLNILSHAASNNPGYGSGADIYQNFVKKAMIDINRIVFNHALTLMVTGKPYPRAVRHYTKEKDSYELSQSGRYRMVFGRIALRCDCTNEVWNREYAVIHLGNYEVVGGVREYSGDEPFLGMQRKIVDDLAGPDPKNIVAIMEQEFGTSVYSFWHLFKDAQREILSLLLESTLMSMESSFREAYRKHITLIHAMKEMDIPVPRILEDPVWYVLNTDLNRALTDENTDLQKIRQLVNALTRGNFPPDRTILNYSASRLYASLTRKMKTATEDIRILQTIVEIFSILAPLSLDYDLWECQNEYFRIGRQYACQVRREAEAGDPRAREWISVFTELGTWLGVKCIG